MNSLATRKPQRPNPYCHLWIVLFRYGRTEPFEIHREALRPRGFDTKRDAEHAARNLRPYVGRGNVYVQKYGPYR
jgi:hypothetical protein